MVEAKVDANDVLRQLDLTVRVTGLRERAVRNWLGTQLIRLAAWVIGVHSLDVVFSEADYAD